MCSGHQQLCQLSSWLNLTLLFLDHPKVMWEWAVTKALSAHGADDSGIARVSQTMVCMDTGCSRM